MLFKADTGSRPVRFKSLVMLTPALGCFGEDMNKIINYAKLIKELPINEQSTRIKKVVWERIVYREKEEIEK